MTVPLRILLVGGGMYVTGRGADGYRGTIAPAVLEARRAGQIGALSVTTTNADSANGAAAKIKALGDEMGVDGGCSVFPASGADEKAFIKAAEETNADAAIIAVPDHLHADITIPLLECGIHCLVVKPMADSPENAKQMAAAAQKPRLSPRSNFISASTKPIC